MQFPFPLTTPVWTGIMFFFFKKGPTTLGPPSLHTKYSFYGHSKGASGSLNLNNQPKHALECWGVTKCIYLELVAEKGRRKIIVEIDKRSAWHSLHQLHHDAARSSDGACHLLVGYGVITSDLSKKIWLFCCKSKIMKFSTIIYNAWIMKFFITIYNAWIMKFFITIYNAGIMKFFITIYNTWIMKYIITICNNQLQCSNAPPPPSQKTLF